jgi:alkanesulfonate monooxygenase
MKTRKTESLNVFTTCPASAMSEQAGAMKRLQEVSRWSEEAGCEGMLVFSDNRQLDPWLVSQAIIEATEKLAPLVAVQPAYMHPYAVAKMIASIAFMYGRRVYLNMVAGGFKNDLEALNDPTPHDERYARLVEYTSIVQALTGTPDSVSFGGRYYTVNNLKLTPQVAPSLLPGVLVSGSSEAGMNAARQVSATPVEYPQQASQYHGLAHRAKVASGIRIGIVARDSDDEAWRAARARFPEDRKGQLTRKMATKVSDSHWHKQLADMEDAAERGEPYWMGPFNNYQAMCPYLVGSHATVAAEIQKYASVGFRTFILDEPQDREDLFHSASVFRFAREALAAA